MKSDCGCGGKAASTPAPVKEGARNVAAGKAFRPTIRQSANQATLKTYKQPGIGRILG